MVDRAGGAPTTPAEIAAEARRLDGLLVGGVPAPGWHSEIMRFEDRFLSAAGRRGEGLEDLDLALAYLQADPWCHRSGYTAGKILRAVAHQQLTGEQAEIAKRYVLHRATNPRQGLLKHTALLGASMWDADLSARFDELLAMDGATVQRSARWLRDAIELRRPVFGR